MSVVVSQKDDKNQHVINFTTIVADVHNPKAQTIDDSTILFI